MKTRSAISGLAITLTLVLAPVSPAFSGDRNQTRDTSQTAVEELASTEQTVSGVESRVARADDRATAARVRGALVLVYLGLASKCAKGACPSGAGR